MYFVGIDISKFKHDCAIIDEIGNVTPVPRIVYATRIYYPLLYRSIFSSLCYRVVVFRVPLQGLYRFVD